MHELSLCRSIVETAQHHAKGRRVCRVAVRVGYFRQVVPNTLITYWRASTEGSNLERSELQIEHVPATIRCSDCDHETILGVPILMCGSCRSTNVKLMTGDEFQVVEMDVMEPSA